MSSQLSDLAFFYFLYAFYDTLDKQVGNPHKPRDLVDQVNHTACVWSYYEDGPDCLHFMIPKFFFGSTSCFHIARTLESSDLNGLSNRE